MLRLHNPHSILAALETRPEDVSEIIISQPGGAGRNLGEGWERVVQKAKEARVKVTTSSGSPKARADRDPQGATQGGRTSVAEAVVRERESVSLEELFSGAREKGEGKGLWLALDCLQDPQNVGAIFRTAAFFGVQGVLLTQERSAPLTATVYDVAAGGMEYLPFTLQINLQRAFEQAKEEGLWILGGSEHAKQDLATVERDRPWLLVIGNEEKGMRRLTEESCDVLCRINPAGGVTSLNASVAAAVFISKLSG